MGLLDSVLGAINNNGNNSNSGNTGSGGSDGLGGLMGMVASNPQIIQVVMSLLSNEGGQGGLSNLMAKFQQAGMGDVIQSWVGSGENMPVSGNQMEQARPRPIFDRDVQLFQRAPAIHVIRIDHAPRPDANRHRQVRSRWQHRCRPA